MTERGVVTKIKGKKATVQFDRKSACDSCHMCAVTRDGMKVQIVIDNTLDANVGDFVEVQMGDKFVVTAALIVYVIPLLLTAIGIGVGTLLGELAQILLAVGGLVLGFVIAFLLDRFVIRKKKQFAPVMTAVCAPDLTVYAPPAAEENGHSCADCKRADCDSRGKNEGCARLAGEEETADGE